MYPLISILIPTYNSDGTLELCLKSLLKQNYPQNKLETIVVDGGSKDDTLKIARKFHCRIISNPKTDIVHAEYLGYKNAKGKYLIGLAPDEILENPNSIKLKYSAASKDNRVRTVLPSGYKTPDKYSTINYYVNEFGDPFSYFIYRDSKGYQYLINDLKKKYDVILDDDECVVFTFENKKKLPLVEIWAGGCMIYLVYTKNNFPNIIKNHSLIPLIFYLLNSKKALMAVTKNDPTLHYSSDSVNKYLKKIRSRVEFNVFKTAMGRGGYYGREKISREMFKYKKYFFIVYSFLLIIPIMDSVYLTLTRKKIIFLIHPFLCIYTAYLIIYYHVIKILKVKHVIKLYGY